MKNCRTCKEAINEDLDPFTTHFVVNKKTQETTESYTCWTCKKILALEPYTKDKRLSTSLIMDVVCDRKHVLHEEIAPAYEQITKMIKQAEASDTHTKLLEAVDKHQRVSAKRGKMVAMGFASAGRVLVTIENDQGFISFCCDESSRGRAGLQGLDGTMEQITQLLTEYINGFKFKYDKKISYCGF